MPENIVVRCEELISRGIQLTPLGGFDFSGYNARLQNKYLEWRTACLETVDLAGPIGFAYKQKILGDANGGYFFQSSAQLILSCIRDLHEKLKNSQQFVSTPSAQITDLPAPDMPLTAETGGVRVLKPPPKQSSPQSVPNSLSQAQSSHLSQQSPSNNKVYMIGEKDDSLCAQLHQFLGEIGLQDISIEREQGHMLPLDSLQMDAEVKFAFFVINTSDLSYAMFEIGHFVGKLGKNHVCVLHMTDVNLPKNMPGVLIKSIVVKLEEASFGMMKELKAAGYQIVL